MRLQGVDALCTQEDLCPWACVVCFEVAAKMIRKVNFGCGICVYLKNAIYCNSLMSLEMQTMAAAAVGFFLFHQQHLAPVALRAPVK